MLWHQQLGNIDKKGLRVMHNKGMVEGFLDCSVEFNFFEHCVYGKLNQVSFPAKSTRAKIIVELVHNDAFRPMVVPSLGGYRYYVSFINNFSRMTWLYFMKARKLEVFENFLEFRALVENQTNKRIKVSITNNGGEFCGKKFDQLCRQHSIA